MTHETWCCVEHPGTSCDDQCPACAGPLDIDNEQCVCGYDARTPEALRAARPLELVKDDRSA